MRARVRRTSRPSGASVARDPCVHAQRCSRVPAERVARAPAEERRALHRQSAHRRQRSVAVRAPDRCVAYNIGLQAGESCLYAELRRGRRVLHRPAAACARSRPVLMGRELRSRWSRPAQGRRTPTGCVSALRAKTISGSGGLPNGTACAAPCWPRRSTPSITGTSTSSGRADVRWTSACRARWRPSSATTALGLVPGRAAAAPAGARAATWCLSPGQRRLLADAADPRDHANDTPLPVVSRGAASGRAAPSGGGRRCRRVACSSFRSTGSIRSRAGTPPADAGARRRFARLGCPGRKVIAGVRCFLGTRSASLSRSGYAHILLVTGT